MNYAIALFCAYYRRERASYMKTWYRKEENFLMKVHLTIVPVNSIINLEAMALRKRYAYINKIQAQQHVRKRRAREE